MRAINECLVLVVEDCPDTQSFIRAVLRQDLGVQVAVASDGATALRLINEVRPDLILLDLALPVLSGLVVARRVKAEPSTASIPIVAMSGTIRISGSTRASAAGCEAYLAKPFDLGELLGTVRRHLHPPPPLPASPHALARREHGGAHRSRPDAPIRSRRSRHRGAH